MRAYARIPLLWPRRAHTSETQQGKASAVSVARLSIAPDRLEALRRAFDATMKDPEFLNYARKASLQVDPITGD